MCSYDGTYDILLTSLSPYFPAISQRKHTKEITRCQIDPRPYVSNLQC